MPLPKESPATSTIFTYESFSPIVVQIQFQIDDVPNAVTPPSNDNDECTTISQVQVVGVPQMDVYRACLQCKARVEPCTQPLGKCTKPECHMMQLLICALNRYPLVFCCGT